jgi:hypothetical protein
MLKKQNISSSKLFEKQLKGLTESKVSDLI